tara:strand:- start:2197 stop:2445 length:249 start_codon:yes stop_codon:yes gene_type:complete
MIKQINFSMKGKTYKATFQRMVNKYGMNEIVITLPNGLKTIVNGVAKFDQFVFEYGQNRKARLTSKSLNDALLTFIKTTPRI